ncbi:type II secretion system protein [Vibrio vulnificus]|nr:type II secretion system protein [Vibrio vulnificus]
MKKQTMRKSKKQTGFTIVEALIVIVILAIVLGVAYNRYANWKQSNNREIVKNMITKVLDNAPQTRNARGSFDGVNNAYVYNSARLSLSNHRSPTANQFITPYSSNGITWEAVNGATLLDGTTLSATNQYLKGTIHSVPQALCVDTVEDFIDKVLEVQVAGTRITHANTATQCAAAGTTTDIAVIGQ